MKKLDELLEWLGANYKWDIINTYNGNIVIYTNNQIQLFKDIAKQGFNFKDFCAAVTIKNNG